MVLNYRMIGRISGMVLLILGTAMIPCVFISFIFGESNIALTFIYCLVPMVLFGLTAQLIKSSGKRTTTRDGFVIVTLCWFLASLASAMPYVISGTIPNFIDALFESVSGLTATGATILTNVEILPKGILFWRAFTQWLGGIGILAFAIVILPALGIGSQQILRVETPGPVLDRLTPKVSDMSKILYLVYFSMTALEFILLLPSGMSPYDALLHTFGTVSSGGFSIHSDGVGHFNSVYIEAVTFIFMIAVGMNFHVFYNALRGHFRILFKDEEVRLYLLLIAASSFAIALNLFFTNTYNSISDIIRYSFFHSAAVLSTTTYVSTDAYLWPTFSKTVLFVLMFIGGCSASTAGAIKVIRLLVVGKMVNRGFNIRLHHRAIVPIKVNGRRLPSDTSISITAFLILYFVLFAAGSLLISLDDQGIILSIAAVASALGNGGCCFELVGPGMDFSIFSAPSKVLLSFLMLAGRLELFTVILLLTPGFWNPDH